MLVSDPGSKCSSRLSSEDKDRKAHSLSNSKKYCPGSREYEEALAKIRHDDSPRKDIPVPEWLQKWDEKWEHSLRQSMRKRTSSRNHPSRSNLGI